VFSFPPLTPVVKNLIITLFCAFVLQVVLNFAHISVEMLALDPAHLGPLTILQVVSYVLVRPISEGQIFGLLVDLFFLWLIVSPFESAFGRRHTIELMLAGTLGGSLVVLPVALFAPSPNPAWVLFGSQSLTFAGMAAMTQMIGAGRKIMLFGVVPMTARQLLLAIVGFSLLSFLISRDHLMFVSSLGAMAAGIGYVKYMSRAPRPSARSKRPATRFRVVRGGGGSDDSDRPKWLN
jgi:membrane associated rhomboid family serine protease